LTGKVKRIEELVYSGTVTDDTQSRYLTKAQLSFDEKGNMSERVLYEGQKFKERIKFTYSPTGLGITKSIYSEGGSLYSTKYFNFNRSNNLQEEGSRFPSGRNVVEMTYEYDQYGHTVKTMIRKDVITDENIYSPDSLLIEKRTSRNGESLGKFIFEYDSKGRQTKSESIGASGKTLNTQLYAYNKENRLIKYSRIEQGGYQYTDTYKYDKLDNITEYAKRTENINNIPNENYHLKDGEMVKSPQTNPKIYTTSYVYDKQGNCTIVVKEDGMVVSTRLLKIMYY
jgi:hypothetical protein